MAIYNNLKIGYNQGDGNDGQKLMVENRGEKNVGSKRFI